MSPSTTKCLVRWNFFYVSKRSPFFIVTPTPAESPMDAAVLQCSTLDCTAAQWLLSSAMASKVIPRYLMAHYKPLYRNNTDDTTQHQHNFKREKLDTWTHQTLTKVPCHNFRNFLSTPAQGIRLCLFNLSSQMTSSFSPV